VGVGFGIRDAASACAVGRSADAVVIGTRLIQLLDSAPPEQAGAVACAFMAELRQALDGLEDGGASATGGGGAGGPVTLAPAGNRG